MDADSSGAAGEKATVKAKDLPKVVEGDKEVQEKLSKAKRRSVSLMKWRWLSWSVGSFFGRVGGALIERGFEGADLLLPFPLHPHHPTSHHVPPLPRTGQRKRSPLPRPNPSWVLRGRNEGLLFSIRGRFEVEVG